MDKDTQLPAEVLDKITHEAEVIYNKLDSAARDYDEYEYGLPMFEKCKEPIERALTEYASKLHAAELSEKEYKGVANMPLRVPMYLLNEQQAYSNHGQSLARLKDRGGLSIREALSLISRHPFEYYKGMEARKAVTMLNDFINQKEDKQ